MGLYKKVKKETSKPQELDVEKIASEKPAEKKVVPKQKVSSAKARMLVSEVQSIKPLMQTIFDQQKAMMEKLDELVKTDKKVHDKADEEAKKIVDKIEAECDVHEDVTPIQDQK